MPVLFEIPKSKGICKELNDTRHRYSPGERSKMMGGLNRPGQKFRNDNCPPLLGFFQNLWGHPLSHDGVFSISMKRVIRSRTFIVTKLNRGVLETSSTSILR